MGRIHQYTKGDLSYYITITFSCLEYLNFDLSWVCYFSCFSITMAAPWLTVHFCRQSMDYHMVVYMSGHKIRKMCNPRPITLHEIHMSPSLFRNLLTQGFSYRPLKWQTDGDSRSPSVNDRTMDPGSAVHVMALHHLTHRGPWGWHLDSVFQVYKRNLPIRVNVYVLGYEHYCKKWFTTWLIIYYYYNAYTV